jgi:CRP/FNR family transcriptional activator FtrB
MRPEDIPAIRRLTLFSHMGEDSFDRLLQASYLQIFPPQVQLIAEGDPPDFLHVVVEGSVELFAGSNGREATIAQVSPVSTFVLAAVLKDASYLMSARTLEKSRILLIPSGDIRQVFSEDHAFARSIVAELATAFRAIVKEHKNHKLRTAVERLANRLLQLHRDQAADGVVTLPCDKRLLASLLGMTPENLSRSFGTLKPYGVVVNGAEVQLNDLKALATLAKPNPLIDDRSV